MKSLNTINSVSSDTLNQSNLIQFPNTQSDTPKQHGSYYKGTTEPIRSKDKIEEAKEYFFNKPERYEENSLRDFCMFILNINIGRRIGDLLQLKICDVENENKEIKDKIIFHESKTGKITPVFLNNNAKEAIKTFLEKRKYYNQQEYLFKSRNGLNKPINRQQAWKIISDMGKEIELKNIGTHSMRKTMGYQYIQSHKNDIFAMSKLSQSFNHSSEAITRKYIGINEEEMQNMYNENNL